MKRISSKWMPLKKKALPFFFVGIGLAVLGLMFATGGVRRQPVMVVPPLLIAVLGVVLTRRFVCDLADEVFDCGDSLLVRNGGKEERIAFSNIMNVNASVMINPPRITLRLDKPGRFGRDVSFSPERSSALFRNPFKPSPLADDLIGRVDQARVKRARTLT